jgi:hypothetical protein
MTWLAMTAMVPTIERTALDEDPRASTSQTQAIGNRGSRFFITDWRIKIPDITPNSILTNIKNCLSHLNTQSLLKSFTSANSVVRFVAVLSKLSNQMMKKWYGTIVFILANPTLWMPIPVMICWSLKERRSLRKTGTDVDLRRPRRIMVEERMRATKLVMMKERSVPVLVSR